MHPRLRPVEQLECLLCLLRRRNADTDVLEPRVFVRRCGLRWYIQPSVQYTGVSDTHSHTNPHSHDHPDPHALSRLPRPNICLLALRLGASLPGAYNLCPCCAKDRLAYHHRHPTNKPGSVCL